MQLEPIDEIQSNILGIIQGLLVSYGLNPDHVAARYEYISTLNPNEITSIYTPIYSDHEQYSDDSASLHQPPCDMGEVVQSYFGESDKPWGEDYENEFGYETDEDEIAEVAEGIEKKMMVSSRKEFCAMMQKGVKICPQYSNCNLDTCDKFHIEDEHICKHRTRGNYCDVNTCELIVIRACRKGKRCNEPDCSFRH